MVNQNYLHLKATSTLFAPGYQPEDGSQRLRRVFFNGGVFIIVAPSANHGVLSKREAQQHPNGYIRMLVFYYPVEY
jgi:hypothetical protein